MKQWAWYIVGTQCVSPLLFTGAVVCLIDYPTTAIFSFNYIESIKKLQSFLNSFEG